MSQRLFASSSLSDSRAHVFGRLRPGGSLVAAAPGTKFYVPTRTDRASKTKARRLHGEGKSTLDIALELHVSERYVRMLLQVRKSFPKFRKVDDRQIDLENLLKSSAQT